jgi:hypothetical protein
MIHRWRQRIFFAFSICTLGIFSLFPVQQAYATISADTVLFESPTDGSKVAGVSLIRGWAFDTEAGVTISSVEWFLNNVRQSNIPCCSERADVRDAFPQHPIANTFNSGFGLTFNWGNLSAGTYMIRVEVHTSNGGFFSSGNRQITVVNLGNFTFLDLFNADVDESFTEVESDGSICVENIQIRDKASGETKFVMAKFAWQEACQCLTLISTEEDGECSFE